MGVKSTSKIEEYYNYFAASGYDAAGPPPGPPVVAWGDRGIYAGGAAGTNKDVIDYISIPSTGNATTFSQLTAARAGAAGVSNASRGVWMGGAGSTDTIDYVTISSISNATDFGDLITARQSCNSGCSSDVRGLVQGGWTGSNINSIEYITIATTGDASDFGDLTQARNNAAGSGDGTYGLAAGGHSGSYSNVIDYVTIATTGNSTDFGDMTNVKYAAAGAPHPTRATFFGGYTDTPSGQYEDNIDYVTIATPGNATDFGDMTTAWGWVGACGNDTRATKGGGEPNTNVIEYVTVATTGKATDFGD